MNVNGTLLASLTETWRQAARRLPRSGKQRDIAAKAFALGAAAAVDQLRPHLVTADVTADLTTWAFIVAIRGAADLDKDPA